MGFLSWLIVIKFLRYLKIRLKNIARKLSLNELASSSVNFVQPCAGNLGWVLQETVVVHPSSAKCLPGMVERNCLHRAAGGLAGRPPGSKVRPTFQENKQNPGWALRGVTG